MNEDNDRNQEVSSGQGYATGQPVSPPPPGEDTVIPAVSRPFEEIPIGYPMEDAEFNRLKSDAESGSSEEAPDYWQPIAPQEDSDDGR